MPSLCAGKTEEELLRTGSNQGRLATQGSQIPSRILSFPSLCAGETEEQFQRTVALVREVGFDRVNTAAYSPRPATPAAAWPGQLADLVKLDRLNRLNAVVNEVAEERAQRFLGRDLEVRVVRRWN